MASLGQKRILMSKRSNGFKKSLKMLRFDKDHWLLKSSLGIDKRELTLAEVLH